MLESYQIKFNIENGFKTVATFLESPAENEVIVVPEATGICGSDLYLIHKAKKIELKDIILGHEWYGRVLSVGKRVKDFKVGNLVTGTGHIACGSCKSCLEELTNVCEKISHFSSNDNGSLVQHFRINSFDIVKIPEVENHKPLILLEIFSIGEEAYSLAVKNNFELDHSTSLIFGAGPIGLAVAQVLKSYGIRTLLVDVDLFRVEHAKKYGFESILLQEALFDEKLKNSFVSIFDCSNDYNGKSGGFKFINYFTKKSYRALIVGKYLENQKITDQFNSKLAQLVFMRGTSKKTLLLTVAKWATKLNALFSQFVTHEFHILKATEAFEVALGQSNCIKVILKSSLS